MNHAKTPFDYVYFSQEFGTVGVDKQIRAVFSGSFTSHLFEAQVFLLCPGLNLECVLFTSHHGANGPKHSKRGNLGDPPPNCTRRTMLM